MWCLTGEMVVQQDEPGNTFYIMYEGKVDIIKDGSVVANLEAFLDLFSRASKSLFLAAARGEERHGVKTAPKHAYRVDIEHRYEYTCVYTYKYIYMYI